MFFFLQEIIDVEFDCFEYGGFGLLIVRDKNLIFFVLFINEVMLGGVVVKIGFMDKGERV